MKTEHDKSKSNDHLTPPNQPDNQTPQVHEPQGAESLPSDNELIEVREEQRYTYSKVTRILMSDARIKNNHPLLAMLALGMYTNDGGSCYPSIEKLCMLARLSPNSLRKGLRELEECGYLDIVRRKNPDNPKENLPNLYKVFPYHKSLHQARIPKVPQEKKGGVPHEVKEGTSRGEGGVPHEVKGNYTHSNYTHQQQENAVNKNTQERSSGEGETPLPVTPDIKATMEALAEIGIRDFPRTRQSINVAIKNGIPLEEIPEFARWLLACSKGAGPGYVINHLNDSKDSASYLSETKKYDYEEDLKKAISYRDNWEPMPEGAPGLAEMFNKQAAS